MAIRHIWRWSTLYVIVELKIKTVRYHCTSIRIAQKQNTTPNTGKNRRRHELSFIADGNTKMTQPLWKIVWQFPTKLSILLKHDPAILLICIFPKWLKMYMHTKICIGMFITVLHSVRSVQSLSHVWFWDPMNRSMPGLPVHHRLPEFTQTHVHQVSDAIQPPHPLSSPSPPAPNPSQDQSLFQWVNSSHEVAKVLEFQLQHQSFQWTPRTDLL